MWSSRASAAAVEYGLLLSLVCLYSSPRLIASINLRDAGNHTLSGSHKDESSLPLCSFSKIQAEGVWLPENAVNVVGGVKNAHSYGQTLTRTGKREKKSRNKGKRSRKQSPSNYRWKHTGCDSQSYGIPDKARISKFMKGRRILFLGDSTMKRLQDAFANLDGTECGRSYRQQQGRCNLARYLRVPSPNPYPQGQKKRLGEGPFGFGLDNPGCTDCSTCVSMASRCAAGSTVEYIAMEYSLDTVVSFEQHATRQDVIIDYYLAMPENRPDVVIVNSGLHHMQMCSFPRFRKHFPGQYRACWQSRAAIFAAQARNVLQRLQHVASTVIWVTINAVNDALQERRRLSFSNFQSSVDFNRAMETVLQEQRVSVLDVFRMSSDKYAMHELHSDPNHLFNHRMLYYRELAGMLAHAMLQIVVIATDDNN